MRGHGGQACPAGGVGPASQGGSRGRRGRRRGVRLLLLQICALHQLLSKGVSEPFKRGSGPGWERVTAGARRWEQWPGWGDLGDIQDVAWAGEWSTAGGFHPGWLTQSSQGLSPLIPFKPEDWDRLGHGDSGQRLTDALPGIECLSWRRWSLEGLKGGKSRQRAGRGEATGRRSQGSAWGAGADRSALGLPLVTPAPRGWQQLSGLRRRLWHKPGCGG